MFRGTGDKVLDALVDTFLNLRNRHIVAKSTKDSAVETEAKLKTQLKKATRALIKHVGFKPKNQDIRLIPINDMGVAIRLSTRRSVLDPKDVVEVRVERFHTHRPL